MRTGKLPPIADSISVETIPGPDGMLGQAVFLGPHRTLGERWQNVLAVVVTGHGMQAVVGTEQARSLLFGQMYKRKEKPVPTDISGYSFGPEPPFPTPDGPPCPICQSDPCQHPCVASQHELAALDLAAWEQEEMQAAVEELSVVGFERLARGE